VTGTASLTCHAGDGLSQLSRLTKNLIGPKHVQMQCHLRFRDGYTRLASDLQPIGSRQVCIAITTEAAYGNANVFRKLRIGGTMKLKKTTGRQLLLALTLTMLALGLAFHPPKAQAQIIGSLEATIPYQFYAGNAKFPAGKYVIRPMDDSDLTIMEISSVDGTTSALFQVRDAQAKSSPAKNELVFKKYGNRYFLDKLFDEANPSGSAVLESSYEKKVGQATDESEEHVAANYSGK
jgi:hypothetical protein